MANLKMTAPRQRFRPESYSGLRSKVFSLIAKNSTTQEFFEQNRSAWETLAPMFGLELPENASSEQVLERESKLRSRAHDACRRVYQRVFVPLNTMIKDLPTLKNGDDGIRRIGCIAALPQDKQLWEVCTDEIIDGLEFESDKNLLRNCQTIIKECLDCEIDFKTGEYNAPRRKENRISALDTSRTERANALQQKVNQLFC